MPCTLLSAPSNHSQPPACRYHNSAHLPRPEHPATPPQDVSGAIVSRVEELQAAVVVMPEQPQSFLESLFQTPVAQQVAARCRRPTVLIR